MNFDFDEPWNLPPLPSRCGTGAIEWAQKTSGQRKAEWLAHPPRWHETFGTSVAAEPLPPR